MTVIIVSFFLNYCFVSNAQQVESKTKPAVLLGVCHALGSYCKKWMSKLLCPESMLLRMFDVVTEFEGYGNVYIVNPTFGG